MIYNKTKLNKRILTFKQKKFNFRKGQDPCSLIHVSIAIT